MWWPWNREEITKGMVSDIYRAILGRDPEPECIGSYAEAIKSQGLENVLRVFLNSAEYRQGHLDNPIFDLVTAPAMAIQTKLPNGDIDKLWAHVAEVWTSLGYADPFWSVITDEKFRMGSVMDEEKIEAFYSSGNDEIVFIRDFIARAGLPEPLAGAVVTEYGCGLGRATRVLAKEAKKVYAFDVSAPHLKAAEDRLSSEGIDNVEFVLVSSRDDLRFENVDLFFTRLVLQHNPPPVILEILDKAFAALNPNGLACFQVPTYALDYTFDLTSFFENVAPEKTMEMHVVPQNEIFMLADKHGLLPLAVSADGCVGNNKWISNTFLFQKKH